MWKKCPKYDLSPAYCEHCKDPFNFLSSATELRIKPSDSSRLLLLTAETPMGVVHVLRIPRDGRGMELTECPVEELHSCRSAEISASLEAQVREFALREGHLFVPGQRLTYRESTPEGPPQCWHCKQTLSYERGSLGCTKCRSYVCQCGTCWEGFPGGLTWKKEYRGPQGPPPVPPSERRWYVYLARKFADRTHRVTTPCSNASRSGGRREASTPSPSAVDPARSSARSRPSSQGLRRTACRL